MISNLKKKIEEKWFKDFSLYSIVMTTIYDDRQKELIKSWNERFPEKRRQIGLICQRRYGAKKRDWKNICKVFSAILLN